MNMHTTIPPAADRDRIWADACARPGAIARNPMMFVRLAELLNMSSRRDVGDAIEVLIEALDLCDGDRDLEEDDEREEERDGPIATLLPMLPVYGIDQRRGPLNERQAYREWQLREQIA